MGMVKLLFSFHGRISRSQYWLGGLVVFIAVLIAVIAAALKLGGAIQQYSDGGGVDLSVIPALLGVGLIYLVGLWCGAALNVKRLHDRGRTGYITLLAFVPALILINALMSSGGDMAHMVSAGLMTNLVSTLINLYFFIDLGLMPGKPEPNQYGDPPRPGGLSSPPPVRPTGTGPAPAYALNSAQDAMERMIAAQSTPRSAQPQAAAPRTQAAPPVVRTASAPPPRAPAPQPTPSATPGAPRAFGKRAI